MASTKKRLSKVQRLACLGITGAICTTPTGAMEAFTGLPLLDLVIQGESRSAAHCLWSVGCRSYLHPSQGHSCILTQLPKSDCIFNMGVNVMKPVFNLEPKYRVPMLSREEWTKGPGRNPSVVKGLVCFMDGSRTVEGTGAGIYGQSVDRRLSISLGKPTIAFQAEVYAISAHGHEIETQDRPEKCVSICSDRQLCKCFRLPKQCLPWYDSARRRRMTSLPGTLFGCTGSLGMPGCEEMELLTSSQGMVLFRSL